MKKLIALGTVTTVSLVTLMAGATAASAAPSTLTGLSYTPSVGTLSTVIVEEVNGGISSANVTGCMVKLADGAPIGFIDLLDASLSGTGTPDTFGFTTAPVTGTTTYTTNIYNDILCADVLPSDVPVSASFTMLPDATFSFTTPTVAMTEGFVYINRPVPYTTNGSFDFTTGGEFTVSSSSPNPLPAGLVLSGATSSSGQPALTISGSPTVTGTIPVDFVLTDYHGNSTVSTLTFDIAAAPVYTATVDSDITVVEDAASTTNPISITTSGFNWDNGGVISLDTTTVGCDALPAWASFTGDFWDGISTPTFSAAGVQPSVSLVGSAPTGSVGTFNLCLLVEDQNGASAVAPFTLTVSAATPVPPTPPTPTPVPVPADTTTPLAYTGANVLPALGLGSLLLLLGVGVMFVARTRKARN